MDKFAVRRREELYGSTRNEETDSLRQTLTRSHILRDGEFNIHKNSQTPGFQWSTTTVDDYKGSLTAAEQGKQYDESYKKTTGSYIPIKQQGVPVDTYRHTTTKDDYNHKGIQPKRGYIGNDLTTNWPDMTPRLIKDIQLGQSEYHDVYVTDELDYQARPHYGKINTMKAKLPLPFDERKHKVNVSLGSEANPVGLSSEAASRYLKTNPKKFDMAAIQEMKGEMEWKSRIFRQGDYNSEGEGMHQTQFDIDYGKRPRGATQTKLPNQTDSAENSERLLENSIEEKLHFIPQLIDGSMKTDTTRQDGEDGKKYHISSHFNLGADQDQAMSVYHKDYLGVRGYLKPDRVKPRDANVLSSELPFKHQTSSSIDYSGTGEVNAIKAGNQIIREANMRKQNLNHISMSGGGDEKPMTVSTRDFQPPKSYRMMSPAKERKCEFNFLESDGVLSSYSNKLSEKTENRDNFRGAAGINPTSMAAEKVTVMTAAKRRLKSGRRAHFTLGNGQPSYNTVTADTFTGRQRNDDNVPAAGKVEKIEKEFNHFFMSDNMEDNLIDPGMPTLQESRTALDNYGHRKKPTDINDKLTVTKTDYLPISDRVYTVPQLRQIEAEKIKTSKSLAKTHYFHTDTSNRNNYETTAMASFIKPELMSGKVHLSSLQ